MAQDGDDMSAEEEEVAPESGDEGEPKRRTTRSGKSGPGSATKAKPGTGKAGGAAEEVKAAAAEKSKAKLIVLANDLKGAAKAKEAAEAKKAAGGGSQDGAPKETSTGSGAEGESTKTEASSGSSLSAESAFPVKLEDAAKRVVAEAKKLVGAKEDAVGWFLSNPDYAIPEVNPWNTENKLTTEWRLSRSKLLFDGVLEELEKLQPLLMAQTQGRLAAEVRLEQSAVDLTESLKGLEKRAEEAEARAKKMSAEAAANERQRSARSQAANGRFEAKCVKITNAAIDAAYHVGGAHCVRSIAFRHVRGLFGGETPGPLEEADQELLTRTLFHNAPEDFEMEEAEWVETYPCYGPVVAQPPPKKKARTSTGKFKAAREEPEKVEEPPEAIEESVVDAAEFVLAECSVEIKKESTVVRLNALTAQFLTSLEVLSGAERGDMDFGAMLTGLLCHHLERKDGDFPCGDKAVRAKHGQRK
jgi:hypothetical protein